MGWPILLALTLVIGAIAAPASARAVDPVGSGPTGAGTSRDDITFFGRGYGHGVGMSQHGARGRALAGQSAATILAHYYQGAVPGTISTSTRIRVRVLASFAASATKPLVIVGLGGSWTIDGVDRTFPANATARMTPSMSGGTTTWRLRITSSSGAVLRDATTSHIRFRPAVSATRFQVPARTPTQDTYRGVVRAVLDGTKPIANVVNELKLETYLRGVVPAEMPSTWPTEALKAQAIAARSYAARRLRPGVSWYDVADDTSSQVYLGAEAEKATTDAAISATAGVVLKSGSAIANTLFHSTGGGATEHNENVFVSATGAKVASPVSYLRGSSDRRADGTSYDDGSPYATWKTKAYTLARLSLMFATDARTSVGTLTRLDLSRRGVSGRLIRVTLVGTAGTKVVSGDVFRSVFNAARPVGDPSMRSTLVDTRPVP